MTAVNDERKIKEEIAVYLRNSDIFTTTQRGVTTASTALNLSSATTALIAVSNVRNVRSVTIGSTAINYGSDYEVDYDYSDSGTYKCLFTFTSAQSGTATISYDYGSTDKIFMDFPKPTITISALPRIGMGILDTVTEPGGFGNVNETVVNVTIVVYDVKNEDVDDYIKAIRQKIIERQTGFYRLKVVKPTSTGPLLPLPRDEGKDKIMHKNLDVRGSFVYERN